ncbi:hypothetical protein [Mucilaginibacter aquatilis]|uniref:Uncharacterized protein n=1 Tax=Mucilaginibacter aquatilis TaxID=1517760 RepID=A0A6I4IQB7_9SPHI|nr:hypothetical protein [Mucilaginibacter aquatilis]MVN90874.1 hypothetical protein [Mucilaginibacter aquatilis]
MKMKQYANSRCCILFLLLAISCFACRQPTPITKQPVDKVMLLKLIKKVVVTEYQTPGEGIAVLRSFASHHNIQLIDSNKAFKDTTVLQVRFNPDKDFPVIISTCR